MGGKGEEALTVKDEFDVLIVGAGPAGLTSAANLARAGFHVGVLEEHRQIGNPVNCSGIIGVEAFARFDLSPRLVRHSLDSVEFVSPKGLRWEFRTDAPLAHVVDRSEFDAELGDVACNAGATISLGQRVTDIRTVFGGVAVRVSEGSDSETRVLTCRVVVVATGAGMPLLRKLGFDDIPAKLLGVQTELELPASQVEVYLGHKWAPEGFAWIVPLGRRRSKVGLLCRRDGPRMLERFLQRPDIAERIDITAPATEIRTSVLPLGFLSKSYADRVVVVGEAAGHLKTTTCGGIYYGMLTGEIAADVIASGLEQDRLDSVTLRAYETRWRDLLQDEIETGLKLRRSFKLMSDWGIERLMSLARREGIASLIREKANFDWHRGLISAVLQNTTVGRILGAA